MEKLELDKLKIKEFIRNKKLKTKICSTKKNPILNFY